MHSHRLVSKNSQRAKLARYGVGGSAKSAAASAVHKHEKHDHPGKPLTKLKTGGKVAGEKAKSRGDKKRRGYDDGGQITNPGAEKKRELANSLASAGTKNPADKLNSLTGPNTSSTMDPDTAAKVKNALTGDGMKKGGTAKAKRKWVGGGLDGEGMTGPSMGAPPMMGTPSQRGILTAAPNSGIASQPGMPPMKRGGRTGLARGGRAKDKNGTKINITIGETGKEPPQMIPVPKPVPIPMGGPGGPPGLPPGGPPMGPGGPPMPPPGMGGPPPGLPIMPRARGGRTNMPHLTAGAGSGEGRLQKMHKTIPKRK